MKTNQYVDYWRFSTRTSDTEIKQLEKAIELMKQRTEIIGKLTMADARTYAGRDLLNDLNALQTKINALVELKT